MALEDDIKKAEEEEIRSQKMYDMMAMDAEAMGMRDMAGMMRGMASDERKHAQMMGEMHKRMMGSGIPDRPVPQTYMDWVDLAEDIKQKMPPESWYIINNLLLVISQEEEGPVAEEAKRWLVTKAGELGIS